MHERLRRNIAKHPLFWAALSCCVSVLSWALWPLAGWLMAAAMLPIGRFCGSWRRGVFWAVGAAVAVGVLGWRTKSCQSLENDLLAAGHGKLLAVALKDARGNPHFWSVPVEICGGRWHGGIVWWQGKGEVPVASAQLQGAGNFQPLPEMRNDGEFDRATWMRRQGVAAVFQGEGRTEVTTGQLARLGAAIRNGFRERLTLGLVPESVEALLIRAVVIGESPQDAEPLVAAFRESGTLHAFSVSGLHVAMVGTLGWWVLARMGFPRRRAVLLLIPLMFGYSWLTGNSAPAVRSAWMATLFLAAFALRRKPDLLNALGTVLWVVLLWDARLLFLPGVQLSYGVVAAIAIGTAWTQRYFSWMAEPELYLPTRETNRWQAWWLARRLWLAQSLAVSLAAGIGSAPLTALHFGLVTPISVLAGIFLVPLIFVLLTTSFVVVLVSPIVPLAESVNHANALVAKLCVVTAKGFAAIPGGHFQTNREMVPTLRVFDLDRGAGAVCFSGNGGAVLLDCGDRGGFRQRVLPVLRHFGLDPDAAVFSHPDGGHLGGGVPVWEAFPLRQVIMPVSRSLSPTFRAWLSAAPRVGMKLLSAQQGAYFPLPDGANLEILHVPSAHAVQALADERVAVYRIHWRGWKILFTNDAGQRTEEALLQRGADVTADVLVIGRHRSDLTLSERFLRAVSPRAIVATDAPFPVFERLPQADVHFWRGLGIQVFDQGKSGGITLRMAPSGSLHLAGFVDGSHATLQK